MNNNYLFQYTQQRYKDDYSYLINLDAMKTGVLTIRESSKLFEKNLIRRFYFKTVNTPLGFIWYPIYLGDVKIKNKTDLTFLFNEWHPAVKDRKYLKWLRGKKIKLVLILRNRIVNKENPEVAGISLNNLKQCFDLITTTEYGDAGLYDLMYQPNPFSVIQQAEKSAISSDICFTGADKGRENLIHKLAIESKEHNVKFDFCIVNGTRKNEELRYAEWSSYESMIKQNIESNCILEVLQEGQESSTLRYQEAVCLKKKLLTNNDSVSKQKYYNEQYIQVFHDVDSIDWEFVKERVNVDYHYQGDYSPIKLLEEIDNELHKCEEKLK